MNEKLTVSVPFRDVDGKLHYYETTATVISPIRIGANGVAYRWRFTTFRHKDES